ncbi:MAG: hypothetical protein RLZZ455_719 [Candidatus Parcubacteria bacterium]
MTEQGGSSLPKSSFVARQSFLDASLPEFVDFVGQHISHEVNLFSEVCPDPALAPYLHDAFHDIGPDLLPDEVARELTVIESAALGVKFPHATMYLRQFPAMYRILRNAEIRGEWSREVGDSLFIGSGATVPEVVAAYVVPPTGEDLQRLGELDSTGEYGKILFHTGMQPMYGSLPGHFLFSGSVVAVEPDSSILDLKTSLERRFAIPNEKTQTLPVTLGEAIETGALPSSVDSLLMYRADPAAFTDINPEDLESTDPRIRLYTFAKLMQDVRSLMTPLLERLSDQGQCVITVGQGNSESEQVHRLAFLFTLREFFLEEGYASKVRHFTDDPRDEAVYADLYGSISVLFARKTHSLIPQT